MNDSIAAKARATLEAAAAYEKAGGIAVSDWPQVSRRGLRLFTRERLANAHTPFRATRRSTLALACSRCRAGRNGVNVGAYL